MKTSYGDHESRPTTTDIRLKIHKIRLNSDSFLAKNQTKFRLNWRENQTKLKNWTDNDVVIRKWVQDEFECHQ